MRGVVTRFSVPGVQLCQLPNMPDDLFSVVVAGESGLFEHLAEDEVSILPQYVRAKSGLRIEVETLLSMVNPLATARGSNLGSIARASGNCVAMGS